MNRWQRSSLLLLSIWAVGQSQTISLEKCIEIALANNPAVHSADVKTELQEQKVKEAAAEVTKLLYADVAEKKLKMLKAIALKILSEVFHAFFVQQPFMVRMQPAKVI